MYCTMLVYILQRVVEGRVDAPSADLGLRIKELSFFRCHRVQSGRATHSDDGQDEVRVTGEADRTSRVGLVSSRARSALLIRWMAGAGGR